MQDYRKMTVWQHSHDLAIAIYRHTSNFPSDERFGLTSQLRRAGCSVPSNLVEGAGRRNDREMLRFLSYSLGSACEIEYQVFLAAELGYLDKSASDDLGARAASLKRMLNAFITTLRKRIHQRPTTDDQ
jgi:four helix bundle protein